MCGVYPFGLRHKGYNNNPVTNHPHKYNGKELNEELGLNWYDYGARNYDASLGRWMNIDPLAEIYHTDTPYAYVLNNPLSFIDPDGREVIGVTRNDAEKAHNNINAAFADEKFNALRGLLTRGKNNKNKAFDKIDGDALKEALSGLKGDDLALAEIVTGAINSDAVHKIEYVESENEASSSGSKAVVEHINNNSDIKLQLNENGRLTGGQILALGGKFNNGFNTPTEDGSHSFLGKYSNVFTVFHEVFGHGIASAKKVSDIINNTNAIRTENLVYRVLGKPEEQRTGVGHSGGKVEGHTILPQVKN